MNKMDFAAFKAAVLDTIRDFLPEKFSNAEVSIELVRKSGDLLMSGLVIRSFDKNISPTIYLEQFFKKYSDGADFSEILREIAELRMSKEVEENFDVTAITNWEIAKTRIVPKLLNRDANKNYLADKIYTEVADLVVTYTILLSEDSTGRASVTVTTTMMNLWGITVEELHAVALSNMETLMPHKARGMSEVIGEMMNLTDDELELMGMPRKSCDEDLIVLSSQNGINGAAEILNDKLMQEIEDLFGSVYILPSSIHETILVPEAIAADVTWLLNMVKSVNETEVSAEDKLSDSVYKWSADTGIVIAAA